MRVDLEYLKGFLDVVLDSEHPDFRIDHDDIKPLWEDDEKLKKLVFHMEILSDQGLIESSTDSPGIGFRRMGTGGFNVSLKPLRLTAKGHQFAADLSKPGVFGQLKSSFRDAGPSETVKVVFALGKKALEKKLDDLLE
ncbi:hypothetical protein BKP64_09380 [Marinobacter salinus]|uniref:DUF2513 domain-containing protein n=1 Tax=Marinobacter salinus TaxID=1874317 RepID=A0A1D9GL39_9GAMM|nr:DUF2513 domain-containing protein [Marinobacter salinus]AOY88358.1 hypothetical protein BKP64_09380 [Marinobacter salinus]